LFSSFETQTDFFGHGLVKSSISFSPHELKTMRRAQVRSLGRECAMRAVQRLSGTKPDSLERGASGAPEWPSHIVGSITHSADYASALVGLSKEFRSIGIDSERIISLERAQIVQKKVLTESERSLAERISLEDFADFVTLVFSAKESIFKALHPLVKKMFWFDAVEIYQVNEASNRLEFKLTQDLNSEFKEGFSGLISFHRLDKRLETAFWLTA